MYFQFSPRLIKKYIGEIILIGDLFKVTFYTLQQYYTMTSTTVYAPIDLFGQEKHTEVADFFSAALAYSFEFLRNFEKHIGAREMD